MLHLSPWIPSPPIPFRLPCMAQLLPSANRPPVPFLPHYKFLQLTQNRDFLADDHSIIQSSNLQRQQNN
jgi:hypothetical protein